MKIEGCVDSRAGFRQLIDGWDGIPTCFFFPAYKSSPESSLVAAKCVSQEMCPPSPPLFLIPAAV